MFELSNYAMKNFLPGHHHAQQIQCLLLEAFACPQEGGISSWIENNRVIQQ